jgi:opacity protein-like surface antigen
MKRMLLIASAALMLLPLTVAARGRVAVFVGPRFAPMGWYGYGYGPYSYGPYFGVPNAGQVKLDTKVKDARVFVDGAYAGTSGKLKTMWMRPGTYTIELRAPGRPQFAEKIYVMAGKTVHVEPGFPVTQ